MYLRILLTNSQCLSDGATINCEALLTTKMRSGLIRVAY
jgi:hypothetical protein